MTLDDFDKGMARLERMFNRGTPLGSDTRLEYLHALRFLEAPAFDAAVTMVVETFKPFPSESFPSPATVQDAVTMTQAEDAIFGPRRGRGVPDTSASDFCQLCRNLGLYLGDDGESHICRCEKGRMRRASWPIPYGTRKREARIQEALDELPPGGGPVRGLHEWNPLGFWEPNAIEHERWMERKREEIKRLEARDAEREKRAATAKPRMIDREALRRAVAETKILAEARTKEIEEEEDEIPF